MERPGFAVPAAVACDGDDGTVCVVDSVVCKGVTIVVSHDIDEDCTVCVAVVPVVVGANSLANSIGNTHAN